MNVGEMRKHLEGIDDDVQIVLTGGNDLVEVTYDTKYGWEGRPTLWIEISAYSIYED